MNAPGSGAPLTAPHVTTGGLCRWKAINKEGRHVGLDFYDLLIEGDYTHNRVVGVMAIYRQSPDASCGASAQVERIVTRRLHAKHLLVVVCERCP